MPQDAENNAGGKPRKGKKTAPLGTTASQIDDVATTTAEAAAAVVDHVSSTAADAKSTLTSLADEARTRLSEVVDQQKRAGADQISGVSRAAQSAAGSLDDTSPQLTRLVRGAADGLSHAADDLRIRGIGEIFEGLSAFGRRQPLALFGGAVVVGFLLSRFLKSRNHSPTGSAATDDPHQVTAISAASVPNL